METMLTIGVDAHKRVHAAVAVDALGRLRDQWRGPNTPEGWEALAIWAKGLVEGATAEDVLVRWGIEGAWGYGRGLAQHLVRSGAAVVDVNPRLSAGMRRTSRGRGKTDRIDAQAVARVVVQDAMALPVVAPEDGTTVLALWSQERRELGTQATRLRNQAHALLADLDPSYRTRIPDLTSRRGVAALCDYQAADSTDVLMHARASAVRRLGAQLRLVTEQLAEVTRLMEEAGRIHCAPLTELYGVAALTAAELAGILGPGTRFLTDAALASYAGAAPLEVSSGEVERHRLNRQGHRTLNAILERIALSQGHRYAPAVTYLARKRAEGKSEREARRCLKRFIARAIWRAWQRCTPPTLDDLRPIVILTSDDN